MKKIVLLLLICLILTNIDDIKELKNGKFEDYHVPTASQNEESETAAEEQQEQSGESYDQTKTITVMKDGETVTMTMHDYLFGVLCAEIPASFPKEAIKAQAVSARTYTLNKIKLYEGGAVKDESHGGADMCTDYGHCQAYTGKTPEELWGDDAEFYAEKIRSALEETDGQYVAYESEPIVAVFHSASGPMTEKAEDVWGGSYPYLVSTESSGGEESPKYHGTARFTLNEFTEKIRQLDLSVTFSDGKYIGEVTRSEAGGVKTINIGDKTFKGTDIRTVFGLNSTNFEIKYENGEFVFSTIGYGHGVGMSQYGAREMALSGSTYDEILAHYYQGTEILKLD